MEMKYGT